jgi:hypothetical protein
MKTLIALVLASMVLAACGGGDEPDQFVGPPDCSAGVCR